jgi:hypothetical protein
MAELSYLTPEVIDRLKKVCKDREDKHFHENCHKHYKDACEHYEEMAVHVSGKKPEKLLERVRPREDPAIREYRLQSYEPITKSTCKKALRIVHKIFNSKFYSIRFKEDEKSSLLKKYSMDEYPRFNNIINYLSDYALKKGIADPNAWFLVQPYEIPKLTTERVKPYVTCYLSCDVYYIDDNYALLFDKYEKGNNSESWFYTLVDRMGIYNIVASKKASQELVVAELSRYIHGRNKLPMWQIGGEYSDKYDGLFESYFYPAVPFWNEVIMDHSDLRGAIRTHLFPQKWEVADECEYVEDGKYACQGGYIFNQEQGKKHKCPGCNGAGRKTVKSPYETYLVNKDRFTAEGGLVTPQAPFGYVDIPTEPTKILKEERDAGLQKGLSALNMDVLNNIGTNQSGVSKDIDRRTELQEFLQKIADTYFEVHLPNIFDWFVWYMFGVESGGSQEKLNSIQPDISKPTQFDVYTSAELTAQFKEAKTAQVNPSYLQAKQAEIQNREFQTHPELLKVLNLQLELDPLAEVTRDSVSLMLSDGTVTKEDAIIHDNIRVFIQRAIEEDQKFADKEYMEKLEILRGYAAEVIEMNRITLEMPEDVSPGA